MARKKDAANSKKGNGGTPARQPEGAPVPPPGDQPHIGIMGQYLKDLSFENPNAPQSLAVQSGQPEINISVNVNANQMGESDYEVSLELEARAQHEGKVLFNVEMTYCGLFRLTNIPQDALGAVVLVECPRIIFPFARRVLADATRDGGFPPLMLDPIDFAAMFAQRLAQEQEAAKKGGGEA